MIIPPLKTEGVFSFTTPFNTDELNNKFYTVIGIRSLHEHYKNEDDPLNTIYLPQGLSEEDFKRDLTEDIPVIVLSSPGGRLLYIPANKITGMPTLSGVTYRKKIININLGLLPEDLPLDDIINNMKDVVMDALGIIPTTGVSLHSAPFMKTDTEHEEFQNFISQHPRAKVFKSYKQQFLEKSEEYNALKSKHDQLVEFMCSTWENNVNFVTTIPTQVEQVMTKKIVIDCVSSHREKPFTLKDLGFKICSVIGNTTKDIYAGGFTNKFSQTGVGFYGVLGGVPMEINVKEGLLYNSHLPYVFSDTMSVKFLPFTKQNDGGHTDKTSRCTIEILLDKPIYLTGFKYNAYTSPTDYLYQTRVTLYNHESKLIYNATFEKDRDFNAGASLIDKNIKDALQIIGDIPHPLPDPDL